MSRTHRDASSREEGTHPVEVFQAGRINYLQLNVQSTLVLTLSDFPKLSWAAGAAGNKRLSSAVRCYCKDGSNKPKAEQTDDQLLAT